MALLTAAELLETLQVQGAAPSIPGLETLIARCSAVFATRCGYPPATPGADPSMEPTEYTLDLQGDGSRDLDLEVYPVLLVADVTEVLTDVSLDFAGAEETIALADLQLIKGRHLRLLSTSSSSWTTLPGSVRVTFTAGYATAPSGLKQLIAMGVRNWLDLKATQGKTGTSGNTFTDEAFVPPWVEGPLGAYVLPRAMV